MTILKQDEINKIFIDLGYKVSDKTNEFVYEKNNEFYKLSLVEELNGYVVEFADSKEDADNNLFEDSDVIGNDCDKETLISSIINYFK